VYLLIDISQGKRPTLMNDGSESHFIYFNTYLAGLHPGGGIIATPGKLDNMIFELTLGYLDVLSLAYHRLTIAHKFEQYSNERFSRMLEERIRDEMESENTSRLFEHLANGISPKQAFSYVKHVATLIIDVLDVMVSRRVCGLLTLDNNVEYISRTSNLDFCHCQVNLRIF
jgi:hypothetical protein